MAHPARQDRRDLVLQTRTHVDERGSRDPPLRYLLGRNPPRNRRRRGRDRPAAAPAGCARSQIVTMPNAFALTVRAAISCQAAGAIVDLSEHQDRDGLVHRLSDPLRGGGATTFQLVAAVEGSDHALRDVEISPGKLPLSERIVLLRGPANRSAAFQRLVEIDRRRDRPPSPNPPARRSAPRSGRRCGRACRSSPRNSRRGSTRRLQFSSSSRLTRSPSPPSAWRIPSELPSR